MEKIMLDPTSDDFESHREEGLYYVDKTEMIHQYLSNNFKKRILFTRPRRFGKTMIMTMFRDFLDIRRDSKALFQGLNIMKHHDTVEKYMNQYPVIFLSLKDVNGDSLQDVLEKLSAQLSCVFEQFNELYTSDRISENERKAFNKICGIASDKALVIISLKKLAAMLHKHYGKKAFVIVDEYDVPMAKALGKPCYNDVIDMIQSMLSNVGKTTDCIEALMMSGCLHTVKNSGYTGFNNLAVYSVLSYQYSDCFGFTQDEVAGILSTIGMEDKAGLVKAWYDGYVFGETHIYNPWDVIKYIDETTTGSRNGRPPGNTGYIHRNQGKSLSMASSGRRQMRWNPLKSF